MNGKEKITVIQKNKDNIYKCDTTKPFSVLDTELDTTIYLSGMFAFLTLLTIASIFIGKKADTTTLIVFPIVSFVLAVVSVLFGYLGTRIKKAIKKRLSEAVVSTGMAVSFQNKLADRFWTVRLDDINETIIVSTRNKYLITNKKIAIAKCDDKNYIILKCTLI